MTRPRSEYTALRDLPPNSLVVGYRTGDNVSAEVVQSQGFQVGTDVLPVGPNVIARPTEGATRVAWEAYALGQGMSLEDAQDLTRNELRERFPDPNTEPAAEPEPSVRPTKSASKEAWVEHAVSRGIPREDAEASTKQELQDMIDRFGAEVDADAGQAE